VYQTSSELLEFCRRYYKKTFWSLFFPRTHCTGNAQLGMLCTLHRLWAFVSDWQVLSLIIAGILVVNKTWFGMHYSMQTNTNQCQYMAVNVSSKLGATELATTCRASYTQYIIISHSHLSAVNHTSTVLTLSLAGFHLPNQLQQQQQQCCKKKFLGDVLFSGPFRTVPFSLFTCHEAAPQSQTRGE